MRSRRPTEPIVVAAVVLGSFEKPDRWAAAGAVGFE